MSQASIREARQRMEKATSKLRLAIGLRQGIWLCGISAFVLFFGAVTVCAVDLITAGTAAAYAIGGIIVALIGFGLIVYMHEKDMSVVNLRHARENAQDDYYAELQK